MFSISVLIFMKRMISSDTIGSTLLFNGTTLLRDNKLDNILYSINN